MGTFLLAAAALSPSGCMAPADDDGPRRFNPNELVPASGVVTLNGAPLAGALVTFIPETGLPGVGETDRAGRYDMRTVRSSGVAPGDYKVAISYLVSPEGEPQGLAERNATIPSPAMLEAREQLPADYSDNFRTNQRATVTPRGGTFDFDVKATITPPAKVEHPSPEPAPEGRDAGPAGTDKP